MARSQRLVKWTESHDKYWTDSSGQPTSYNDLTIGEIIFVDLENLPSELTVALSKAGQLGRIVSHTHSVVSHWRIWTLVVEFD